MKSYTITVNGNVYDVTVEENGAVSAPAAAPRRAAAPAPAAAPKAAAPAGGAGNVKIEAGAAGKVFKIESPVVATEDGTVASINVSVGDMVEAGALLATLNN